MDARVAVLVDADLRTDSRDAEVSAVTNTHPLGALIDQAKRANAWSDVDVSNRAKARGHEISKSNIARIRTTPVATIVGKHLYALAEGLGIPVQQVAQAALESMGIPTYSSAANDAEQAVRLDPTLPEHVRRTLLTIIRNERDRRGEVDEQVTQPRTQEGSTEYGSAGRSARRSGAPMKLVKSTDGTDEDQGLDPDGMPPFDPRKGLAAYEIPDEEASMRPTEPTPEDESQDPADHRS